MPLRAPTRSSHPQRARFVTVASASRRGMKVEPLEGAGVPAAAAIFTSCPACLYAFAGFVRALARGSEGASAQVGDIPREQGSNSSAGEKRIEITEVAITEGHASYDPFELELDGLRSKSGDRFDGALEL